MGKGDVSDTAAARPGAFVEGLDQAEPMPPPADETAPPQSTPPPEQLLAVWHPLAAWEPDCFASEPPARRYLLHQGDEGDGAGMLPLGRVGMIAGAGAAGKSWLATELALAVASGADWLGFKVYAPGRVLLILGEEDEPEARRRLYYGARVLGLSDHQRELARERLWVLPLCGRAVALTAEDAAQVPEGRSTDTAAGLPATALYWELLDRLEADAGDGWSLVVLDPLSRFAGPDVEVDNAQATRFVQAVERFTAAPGTPTVIVCHHTTKSHRRGEQGGTGAAAEATAARGASGLTDGVRWQANLEAKTWPPTPPEEKEKTRPPAMAVLRVTKSNYAAFPPERWLVREKDNHGALRLASRAEIRDYEEAREKAAAKRSKKQPATETTTEAEPTERTPLRLKV
jgi:hypothetical protein